LGTGVLRGRKIANNIDDYISLRANTEGIIKKTLHKNLKTKMAEIFKMAGKGGFSRSQNF
jgi:hypothetical protein